MRMCDARDNRRLSSEGDGRAPERRATAGRLVVVCGPTATGKTDLGIALARALDGEIVNADSRQVYREMDIGTAKPDRARRAAVPHHLLDVAAPDEAFTLADYLDRARAVVATIVARGRLPIAVGGTGLYTRALAQGFDVPRVAPDTILRADLDLLLGAGGVPALLERLRARDPRAAAVVDPLNPRRLIRAIEVAEHSEDKATHDPPSAYDALVLGLDGDAETARARADTRIDAMMEEGLLDEVARLRERGYDASSPAFSALGYRELWRVLDGEWTLEDALTATKKATHRFIRRQRTWYRREPGLHPLDMTDPALIAHALAMATNWLRSPESVRHLENDGPPSGHAEVAAPRSEILDGAGPFPTLPETPRAGSER